MPCLTWYWKRLNITVWNVLDETARKGDIFIFIIGVVLVYSELIDSSLIHFSLRNIYFFHNVEYELYSENEMCI